MFKRGTTIAAVALMAVQPMAAAAQNAKGIASNRAALGMPVAAKRTCTTVGGRASCATVDANRIGGTSVFLLIAALAGVAAGVALIGKDKTSPTSP